MFVTSTNQMLVSFSHVSDLCWPSVLMTWSTGSHEGDRHTGGGSEASPADRSWHLTSGRHQFHWSGKLWAGGEHRLWVICRWSKCFPVCCFEITIDCHNSHLSFLSDFPLTSFTLLSTQYWLSLLTCWASTRTVFRRNSPVGKWTPNGVVNLNPLMWLWTENKRATRVTLSPKPSMPVCLTT